MTQLLDEQLEQRRRQAGEKTLANEKATHWAVRQFTPLRDESSPEYQDCLQEVRIALFRACLLYDPTRVSQKTGRPAQENTYRGTAARNAAVRWFMVNQRHGFTHVGDQNPAEKGERAHVRRPARLNQARRDDAARHTDCPDPRSLAGDDGPGFDEADRVRWALDRLREHDARLFSILYCRFYLGESLQDVGLVLGITRERVRQLQKAALVRLRSMIRPAPHGGRRDD